MSEETKPANCERTRKSGNVDFWFEKAEKYANDILYMNTTIDELRAENECLHAENARLRVTNRNLNRRAQAAEAGERQQFKPELYRLRSYEHADEMVREHLERLGFDYMASRGSEYDRAYLRRVTSLLGADAKRTAELERITGPVLKCCGRRAVDHGTVPEFTGMPTQYWCTKSAAYPEPLPVPENMTEWLKERSNA